MDGLECSEINLSETSLNKDFRIDSAFYTTKLIKNSNIRYAPIGDSLIDSQYGVSIAMNEDNTGYPIYRMNEIHNMLCDLNVDKCAELSTDEFKKFKLNNGDVLFNRTNSYEWVGRTGVFYSNTTPCTFASYLVRFIPDERVILPEYLTAYLNTKYGIAEIKRRARQSINQTNVNPEEVKEIQIPLIKKDLQQKIKERFLSAHKNRVVAEKLYDQAEKILLSELGMEDFVPSSETVSVKSLSESFLSSGRLDAEYYQPKYDKLFKAMACFEHKPLGEIVTTKKSIEPGSDYYGDEGIPFVRVSDITKYGISAPEIKLPVDVVPNVKSLYPQKDTILLSKDGSVGIAYKVERDLDVITSGALLHLIVKDKEAVLPDYLALVLNSLVVRLQGERDVSGAIIQHWKPSEIEKVLIPILDEPIQNKISEKIQQSFALRRQSEQLLENAKQAVEIAIEQDEDKALEWLRQH